MTLEVRVAGPGLDIVRTLEPGGDEVLLGRDADCDICLPDPQRNVSRRHLVLWNEQDELRFRVVSAVNGVQSASGEMPPGSEGVLGAGQVLRIADYGVSAVAVSLPAAGDDPWAVLDREHAHAGVHAQPAHGQAEQDPFGDWGFNTTFGPGGAGGGLDAAGLALATDVSALYRGLGLGRDAVLTEGELEAIGRMLRTALLGLVQLQAATAGSRQTLKSDDRTVIAPRQGNPLKSEWPAETKLQYLLGGRATGGALLNPERAMRELVTELLAHQSASAAGTKAVVENTLRDFDPAVLRDRLLGGSKLFEGVRAWDAYGRHYAELARDLPAWVQRLIDRHFTEAYLREFARVKSETPPGGN
jgi:predicted component of type VI protein secretion system